MTTVDLSALVNLQKLWALYNNFTTIDLSANVLLNDLRIEYNDITSIDLSSLVNLQILQINHNELTSIDVSNNTLITRLRVQHNTITELDVSNLTVLNELKASFNNMKSLNVKNGNNTNIGTITLDANDLYCILVDDADYSTTNWTVIDAEATFSETSCDYVIVDIDVFLQGALLNPNAGEDSLMRDDLRAGSMLDTISPYSDTISIPQAISMTDSGPDMWFVWFCG